MTPDSLEWWCYQAQVARENVRKDPTPNNCCLYAMTIGRCALFGKDLGTSYSFGIKKAISAATSFLEMIKELQDRLADVRWMSKVWPEKIVEITPTFLSRRVDILGVQLVMDTAFDEADARYERKIDDLTDDIVNALIDLDSELTDVMPVMREHGNADKVLTYHKKRIDEEYHDQWWLAQKSKKGK